MDYLGYLYACLLAIGGLAGYLKAGSAMSLAMGSLCALVAGVGAYRASVRPDQVYLGLLVSLLVAARSVPRPSTLVPRFGQAFLKTGQVFPAAVVAGLSLTMAVRYGRRLL